MLPFLQLSSTYLLTGDPDDDTDTGIVGSDILNYELPGLGVTIGYVNSSESLKWAGNKRIGTTMIT